MLPSTTLESCSPGGVDHLRGFTRETVMDVLYYGASVASGQLIIDTVAAQMEAKQTLFNVIILDCCRDDPLPGYALGAGGLRRMEPKKSLVVFACEPGKRSAELPRADNGVFAKHLLRHIETPNLRVDDLFIRVRNDVNKATESFRRGMQDPCCFYGLKVENAMLLPQ